MQLSDEQKSRIDSALEAERGRRRPVDPQLPGCLIAFVGMALLTLTPPLGNWIEISQGVARGALLLGAGLLLAGAIFPTLVRMRRGGSDEIQACRRAATALESWGAHDGIELSDEAIAASVALIVNAYTARGRAAVMTPGFDALDAHIEPALPLLRAVEMYLLAQDAAYPVFTRGDGPSR